MDEEEDLTVAHNIAPSSSMLKQSKVVRVKKTKLMHNLFLVYFINPDMFRAYLGPSSGGTTVYIQQWVLTILKRG